MKNKILRYGLVAALILLAASTAGAGGLAKESGSGEAGAHFCGILLVEGERDSQEGREWIDEGLHRLSEAEVIEGEKIGDAWKFPGLEGKVLMCYTEGTYGSEDAAEGCVSDPDISSVALNVNVKYEETASLAGESSDCREQDVSGTLYISADYDKILWMHPIYEREDGSVYVAADEAEAFRPDSLKFTTTEESISSSMEHRDSSTWDANTREEKTKITISAKAAEEIRRVLIKEYTEEDAEIKETEITGEELRGGEQERDFRLQEDTAYVIVEEEKTALTGGERMVRSIYTWGDAYHGYYQAIQPSENSIARQTVFTWVKE